jgi:hypothetical protein
MRVVNGAVKPCVVLAVGSLNPEADRLQREQDARSNFRAGTVCAN